MRKLKDLGASKFGDIHFCDIHRREFSKKNLNKRFCVMIFLVCAYTTDNEMHAKFKS